MRPACGQRCKIITRVFVFLLLGAIVNVAVAWGCVIAPRTQLRWPTRVGQSEFHVTRLDFLAEVTISQVSWRTGYVEIRQELKNWPGTVLVTDEWIPRPAWSRIEPSLGHPLLTELRPENPNVEKFVELTAGWPYLSTRCNWTGDTNWTNPTVYSCRGALHVSSRQGSLPQHHFLPVIPLWPGFAINTIFYAAILWLMFFAPGSLRRTIRRRRGLCPACAYPVGTSPVCTECGKPVQGKGANFS